MLLACVAGPNQTGQQIVTHLFLNILPIIILYLTRIAIPRDQALLQTLVVMVQKTMAWHLQGCACGVHKKRVKRCKKPVKINQESNNTTNKARMYLLPFIFAAFKVGCCIELHLRHFWRPHSWNMKLLALQRSRTEQGQPPQVHLDLDLIPIRVDNNVS